MFYWHSRPRTSIGRQFRALIKKYLNVVFLEHHNTLFAYQTCCLTHFCGITFTTSLSAKGQEGHPGLGLQAADLLLSTRHLLAMSALPALCNVCCICLEHLLLQRRDAERKLMLEETGSKTKRRAIESHEKVIPMARDRRREESTRGLNLRLKPGVGERRESEDPVADVTKGAAQLPPIQAEIPSSLTQVYLSVVVAFLHRDPDKSGRAHPPNIMTLQQR